MSGDSPERLGTIIDRLERRAREHPDSAALVAIGRTVTHRQLHAAVAGCADWLRTHDVDAGERVGVTIPDDLLHFVVILALASLGAAHVTLASHDPAPARSRLAARVGARRLIATAAEHGLPGLSFVAIDPERMAHWARGPAATLQRPMPGALFTFFATSGTTGESKIIPLTHDRLALQSARAHVGRAMPMSSIEHGYAKRQYFYALLEGGTLALRGDDQAPIARTCAALDVDLVIGMSAQGIGLIADAARFGRLPPRTVLLTAGSRSSGPFRRQLLAHVCDAVGVSYSMQECGSIARVTERAASEVSETVGRPHAGVVVEIVDARGAPLPRGESGEIRVRAPGMATGYLDDAEADARHFRDGWFLPSDLGSFTEDGALIVHGRADDVMVMRGIKIAPAEIERALEQHPAVKAVAAFALPSSSHGEIPAAAVELAEGASASEDELRAFARRVLGLRAPRYVTILAALPSTAGGKVDKSRLVDIALRRDSVGGR